MSISFRSRRPDGTSCLSRQCRHPRVRRESCAFLAQKTANSSPKASCAAHQHPTTSAMFDLAVGYTPRVNVATHRPSSDAISRTAAAPVSCRRVMHTTTMLGNSTYHASTVAKAPRAIKTAAAAPSCSVHLQCLDFLEQSPVPMLLENPAPLRLLDLHHHSLWYGNCQAAHLDHISETE